AVASAVTGDQQRLATDLSSELEPRHRPGHFLRALIAPKSQLGQKRKWRNLENMSAVPPTTDIRRGERHVCLVPCQHRHRGYPNARHVRFTPKIGSNGASQTQSRARTSSLLLLQIRRPLPNREQSASQSGAPAHRL